MSELTASDKAKMLAGLLDFAVQVELPQIEAERLVALRDKFAPVITDALAEAERAQMERDCAVVCYKCAEPMKGLLPAALWDGAWRHPVEGEDASLSCHANHIRRAFAALHPEPAS